MKIFYIKIDKFNKEHDEEFLSKYTDKKFASKKRFYEYAIGRYLVKKAAKEKFNLQDTEIETAENGKPFFKHQDLHFSISHSENIVAVCFDIAPCGFDIEVYKERDLNKFSKYYKKNFQTQEEFYKFWTTKEAVFKLNSEAKNVYTDKIEDEYYICIASSSEKKDYIEVIAVN